MVTADEDLVELVARTFWVHEDGFGSEGNGDRKAVYGDAPMKTWESIPEWERDNYRAAAKEVIDVIRTEQTGRV
jgi:hypothetical protein